MTVTTPEIMCMLMELCLEGSAIQVSGNYFAAKGRTSSQQFLQMIFLDRTEKKREEMNYII